MIALAAVGAPLMSLAGLIWPGWNARSVLAIAAVVALAVVATGMAGLGLKWRADLVARTRLEERVKRDRAVFEAWDKASVRLMQTEAEKARIVSAWSTALQGERLKAQALTIELGRLPDNPESSGVHGREIR